MFGKRHQKPQNKRIESAHGFETRAANGQKFPGSKPIPAAPASISAPSRLPPSASRGCINPHAELLHIFL
jgi:hypothetical protein